MILVKFLRFKGALKCFDRAKACAEETFPTPSFSGACIIDIMPYIYYLFFGIQCIMTSKVCNEIKGILYGVYT
jgi:hypothetical protein